VDLAVGDSACGFYFDAVQGSVVSVTAKTAAKRAKRSLRAVVLDPAGNEMTGLSIKSGVGKATVSGIQCPQTGRYFVILASESGDPTQLVGYLKVALPKKATRTVENFSTGKFENITFGALAGAHVTITAKVDKSGLKLRGNLLRDPTGAGVAFQPGEIVEDENGSLVFNKVLTQSGTWLVSLTAKPGFSGTFKWTLKITQPKGGVYSAD
jgi:hypothetical protein